MGYTIQQEKCAVIDIDGELRDFIDTYRSPGGEFFGRVGYDPYEYWYMDVEMSDYHLGNADWLKSKGEREHPQFTVWTRPIKSRWIGVT